MGCNAPMSTSARNSRRRADLQNNGLSLVRTADRVILEAVAFHFGARQQVAAVQNQRTSHAAVYAVPVEIVKLLPLGGDEQSFGAVRRIGIKHPDPRALRDQLLNQIDGG